ncbi:DUF721 domain-containing protein [Nitrosomonas sp.]|uniref:DUF721 domain-containing protein n=1 Tax=Nitrosomonas sp. TaxID=42353 RepID=UPI0025CB8322|nr:DUF721 domain-containing protein [Nitrosomonas sp.]MCC6916235.1 DUF721 domain-containing protein [Nitrosomonas sp.]
MSILNLNNFLSGLDKSPEYGQLFSRAKYLVRIQEQLLSMIPPPLSNRCVAGQHTAEGNLIIYTDSGAIATRLRHLTPIIQQKMNKAGIKVESVRVSIQPRLNFPESKNTGEVSRTLSKVAVEHLSKLSGSLPAGSPLQSSIRALLANQ